MNIQFGECNLDGSPVDPKDLEQVHGVLAPYACDGESRFCKDNLAVLFRGFHTTRESRREAQPHLSARGDLITWDGRLDNRAELIAKSSDELSSAATDLEIVAATYECWSTDSFPMFLGDWATSVWNPKTESILLAKDFAGTRSLYYSVQNHRIMWCTVLDPLLLLSGRSFKLDYEYVAGWLTGLPAVDLTPYVGVHSVPPSSFVRLAQGKHVVRRYWDFTPKKTIRYGTDREYEEHFRTTFAQSVQRRLRSDSPVLAELSGGIDSSSIVCIADALIAAGKAETPRLDTLSYYNESEPNWNERPYFQKVEEKRGRTGCHIDLTSHEMFEIYVDAETLAATPAARLYRSSLDRQSTAYMMSQGNRVVLSGIGGDEFVGGIPTPLPELTDLLIGLRFCVLARQLKLWALRGKRPVVGLLFDCIQQFIPRVVGRRSNQSPLPWLRSAFVKRHRSSLLAQVSRLKILGAAPSFQDAMRTLDGMRKHIACLSVPPNLPFDRRYPYLDRDMIEFLLAIPREQLVRPGQRRSLMRRALAGIVPDEVLNRRRKAYAARGAILAVSRAGATLAAGGTGMVSDTLGIIERRRFAEALHAARHGQEVPIVPLIRTLDLEFWLRDLQEWKLSEKVLDGIGQRACMSTTFAMDKAVRS